MSEIRTAAIEVALEAGSFLRSLLGRVLQVTNKGPIDIVTEADVGAERIIVEKLRRRFPGHGFMAEEGSPGGQASTSAYWIIDPLDGTVNFAHHFPWFAVSVAFVEQGSTLVGVVYNPMLDELFWAERGGGAFLGQTQIRVSQEKILIRSLVATGFPYDVHLFPEEPLAALGAVLSKVQGIRRAGSAALDLAQVAAGRFEGFFEIKLKPWDTAAGALLVEEAGGRCSDFRGNRFDPFAKQLLATNGRIHTEMLDCLR